MAGQLADSYGRIHDYLRISVTDRCNLRCVYCMGPEGVKLLDHDEILSYEEILKIVEAGAALGVRKVRITGGEPLVRKGIAGLIERIAAVPGIADLALTTNGQLLPELGAELKKAGLQRVNISLDSLKPQVYREITRGGDLAKTLAAVETALSLGLTPVKINVVLMKDVNDREIADFLRLASAYPIHLRFIEYMPIDEHDACWQEKYLPLVKVTEEAAALGRPLTACAEGRGRGPAALYRLPGAAGLVGLIRPLSAHFCADCNRLRLTADGYLKPCLYWQEELAVRPALNDRAALMRLLEEALRAKRKQHEMTPQNGNCRGLGDKLRGMSKTGG